jgi:long-chain acyl-CoA synthetase
MSNFLENVFVRLKRDANRVVLREIHDETFVSVTGDELLRRVQVARTNLQRYTLQPGDRCALLAPNSIRWIAIDLALMAEGVTVVPLYSRQAPTELVTVMRDCEPRLLICGDAALGDAVAQAWATVGAKVNAVTSVTFDQLLPLAVQLEGTPVAEAASPGVTAVPNALRDSDLVTIVYTSGTSGEPKGVCLNNSNVSFILSRTAQRFDQLMRGSQGPDSVFHYLPLNFAASWIAILSFLSRDSVVALSSDLNRLADEIRLTSPHYFLNVPTLLERVRRGVEDAIAKRPAPIRSLYAKARDAFQRKLSNSGQALDKLWLALGRKLIFSKVKARFGPNLRALICGSAPLAPETQNFFLMLGVSVLQVYGLTETTGICTMDDPDGTVDTGHVGVATAGVEMRIGDDQEIVVRGPNVFPGYWNREEDSSAVLRDGWFHTGDQGEKNTHGNWRIIGRIKNLIILNSGHKVPPEPIEDKLAQLLPAAQHIVVVGNGRGYLCVLVTGPVEPGSVQPAIETVNFDLAHYRQIRDFALLKETLTPDGGLLTAMGKLRRAAINARFAAEINAMYDSARNPEAARGKSA